MENYMNVDNNNVGLAFEDLSFEEMELSQGAPEISANSFTPSVMFVTWVSVSLFG